MFSTPKEPATCIRSNGEVNRRAELKKRLKTVTVSGKTSELVRLEMESITSSTAYAVFEEKESGEAWAAVILTEADIAGMMSYTLIPEWENPPYYECGAVFLKMLEESGPGKNPAAAKWRKKCWEHGRSFSSFDKMIEGTRIIWTVGECAPAYLPKGKQLMLEKTKHQGKWRWRDMESGLFYTDKMIPESDRQLLETRR